MERIYLDHAATSPVHPAVLDKMTTFMKDYFGNPSSIHSFGRESRREVDETESSLPKVFMPIQKKSYLQAEEQKQII